jgi:preprotein translocase subunit SecD
MLYIPPWQRMLIIAVCFLGVLLSIPNFFLSKTVESWPRFVPKKQVSLGLDLRGGSYLLYEVDMQSAEKDELNNIVEELRTQFAAQKIGYTGLAVDGDHVAFVLSDKGRENDVRQIVQKISPGLQLTISAADAVSITPSAPDLEQRRASAVEQSIEIIRRRIDETGTKEATIQRVGQDRILVELPGIDDPERVKALIGKTAKMTFQMVDTTGSVEDARRGRVPPGDELLQAQEGRAGAPDYYLVRRRVVVGGDTLTSAQPSFGNNN